MRVEWFSRGCAQRGRDAAPYGAFQPIPKSLPTHGKGPLLPAVVLGRVGRLQQMRVSGSRPFDRLALLTLTRHRDPEPGIAWGWVRRSRPGWSGPPWSRGVARQSVRRAPERVGQGNLAPSRRRRRPGRPGFANAGSWGLRRSRRRSALVSPPWRAGAPAAIRRSAGRANGWLSHRQVAAYAGAARGRRIPTTLEVRKGLRPGRRPRASPARRTGRRDAPPPPARARGAFGAGGTGCAAGRCVGAMSAAMSAAVSATPPVVCQTP